MVFIYEDIDNSEDRADKKLRDVWGTTLQKVRRYILDHITDDQDKYFGIYLAYEDDIQPGTRKEVEAFVDTLMKDDIIPSILDGSIEEEYEVTDTIYEMLESEPISREIEIFNDSFDDLVDAQNDIWDRERKYDYDSDF